MGRKIVAVDWKETGPGQMIYSYTIEEMTESPGLPALLIQILDEEIKRLTAEGMNPLAAKNKVYSEVGL